MLDLQGVSWLILRRGRDWAERFELYQIVLNRVDLEVIAVPVYADL